MNHQIYKKNVMITGITGQDGSYLAEYLLSKGYNVYGVVRRCSNLMRPKLNLIKNHKRLFLRYGDMTDQNSLLKIITESKCSSIYNLAAQSHVHTSFAIPNYTFQVNTEGVQNLINSIISLNQSIKLYQASSSEMFGGLKTDKYQDENTSFNPRSPYAISKVAAHQLIKNYREGFDLFFCNGILFNHESPRRSENFVTRKIIKDALSVLAGNLDHITLGNLYSKRDWGFAPDYVEAIYKILNYKKPDDFVIATGETYTVKQFLNYVFDYLGIKYVWTGKGLNEICTNLDTKKIIVKIDKNFFRPTEVDFLRGNPAKAKKILKWEVKTNLQKMIKIMIEEEKDDTYNW